MKQQYIMAMLMVFTVCFWFFFINPLNAVSIDGDKNHIRRPSLYEQYCCLDTNRGESIVLNIEGNFKYFLCPPEAPASCSSVYFPNCSAILTNHPSAKSGYYNIMLANGTVITAYCDMEGVNCDGEGGWMRVAYLNMSDPSEQCPPGFRLYEENGVRACGRQFSGCQSVTFPSYDISYTRVCGRVTGYQKGSTSAIDEISLGGLPRDNINQPYVDGVSITRGDPRKHIWTFMAGLQKDILPDRLEWLCPCSSISSIAPQSFVGNDYFCESGAPGVHDLTTLYTDPLWDGKQCGSLEEACCNVTGIPWFNKVLQQPTTDYIELRVCGDEDINNEDSPVGYYEVFIK